MLLFFSFIKIVIHLDSTLAIVHVSGPHFFIDSTFCDDFRKS